MPVVEEPPVVKEAPFVDRNAGFGSRVGGIVLALAAFIVTIVALFIIPVDLDFSDIGSMKNTLLDIGISKRVDDLAIIAFVIVALVLAIVAVLIPMFTIASGVTVIATAFALYISYKDLVGMTFDGLLTFSIIGAVVIVLGVIASVLMFGYCKKQRVRSTMFMSCIYSWIGAPVRR